MTNGHSAESIKKRPRLVIAGASGFIGTAVCRELLKYYDVVVLTRSPVRPRSVNSDMPVTWHFCDLFSRTDLEKALAGAEYAIYLVHTRMPSSRLTQANSEDMSLLLADNFARAASINGISQIIFLGGMISEENISAKLLQSGNEVEQTLASYGTPVTSLRAGIVVGPGGTFVRLLSNIVLRFPVVIVPDWTRKSNQPISVNEVVRAMLYCIGNQETFGREYDIGGPAVMDCREIFMETAAALGVKRFIITLPYLSRRLYAFWIRIICPGTNSSTINMLAEGFRQNLIATDNPVQRAITNNALPYMKALDGCLDKAKNRPLPNPRIYNRSRDDIDLRFESRVRSIQRFRLPRNRNAEWVAGTFFMWLPEFVWPFVLSRIEEEGSCNFYVRFPRIHLISLTYKPAHCSPNRQMYFITGGLLVRTGGSQKARFEFRDVLNNRFTIGAIHDYAPRLPWYFYTATQAVIHSFVMRAFQKHLDKMSEELIS